MQIDREELVAAARMVVGCEAAALKEMELLIGDSFVAACELILNCRGRVIVTGMGKSGHIAQKIAASLTSTGTPAHFLHPAEGVHGDLGVVHRKDILLAISYSGETSEILGLLPPIKHIGTPVIAITGNPSGRLALQSDAVLLLGTAAEADPYNLVPTTSTTLTLALGDALTVALMQARRFTPEDFAIFHPHGMLGKRLTLQVSTLLRGEETNPLVQLKDTFGKALDVITRYTLGGTSVVDEEGKLAGIITDGDVRRIIQQFGAQGGSVAAAMEMPVLSLMTRNPLHIPSDTLAYDALQIMETHKPRPVLILPVVDQSMKPVGMLHLHALVQAGFKSSLPNEREDLED